MFLLPLSGFRNVWIATEQKNLEWKKKYFSKGVHLYLPQNIYNIQSIINIVKDV